MIIQVLVLLASVLVLCVDRQVVTLFTFFDSSSFLQYHAPLLHVQL